MTGACDDCLRLSLLVGHLAPSIAGRLGSRDRRTAGLLALAPDELIAAVAGPDPAPARRFLRDLDLGAARRDLPRSGVEAVCRHERPYPRRLLELPDPPSVLYAVGGRARLEELAAGPVVTVVGARRASGYALEVAYALGRGLGAAGLVVVSGLALGVDAAAHRGTVDGGGRGIAVLAGGADRPYPRANRRVYERLREASSVISELPPGRAALRWSFPARNRIMAGLADMTVVVEAASSSGSMITAALAADLGREVGAVPGRVTARMAEGSNQLLRDGASVVRDAADVLDALFGAGGGPDLPAGDPGALTGPEANPPPDLEPPLRAVLDGVEAGHETDRIGREAGLSAGEVRTALGRLELMGLIVRTGIGSYGRVAVRRDRAPPAA